MNTIVYDTINPPINLALPTLDASFLSQPNVYQMDATDLAPNRGWSKTQMSSGTLSYTAGRPTRSYSGSNANVGMGIAITTPESGYIKITGNITINSGALSSGDFGWRPYNPTGGSTTSIGSPSGGAFSTVVPIPVGTVEIYLYGYSSAIDYTLDTYSAVECDAGGTPVGVIDLMPSDSLDVWPDEVINPLSYGLEYIILTPGDYSNRKNGIHPANTLQAYEGGTALNPVHYIGVANLADQDLNDLPYPWERAENEQVILGNFAAHTYLPDYDVDYVRLLGFTMRGTAGNFSFGGSTGNVVAKCWWDDYQPVNSWCVYMFLGTSDTVVSQCLMHRRPPFATEVDVVAIYVKTNINPDIRIEYCTAIGYTQGYQTGSGTTGNSPGLVITNCYFGHDDEERVGDGDSYNIAGAEMCVAFKSAGTAVSHATVSNNVFWGTRTSELGQGTYAIVIRDYGSYVDFIGNIIVDCGAAMSANVVAENQNCTFVDSLLSGVKDYGSTVYPDQQGCLLVNGPDATFAFDGNDIIDCDHFSDSARTYGSISGNSVYSAFDYGVQFANQAAWEVSNEVVA